MTIDTLSPFFVQLNTRRKALRMSEQALARRSGVSRATVQRILSGNDPSASFRNVASIALALGLNLNHLFNQTVGVQDFKKQEATKKAQRLVGMVQGNMGLEAQGVSRSEIAKMTEETTYQLLHGSPRDLW